ncbi:MAG TPA: DNA translocase FtsK 4TM domain-containing protein [Fermentimonas sp.]|nr:DNA translocase FtsK 4TM domain-containing protein [Fermentimonas sp.]
MTKRKRKKTSTSKIRSAALLNTLKSERLHFILGVIVAFFGIFMLLAIISFFFTGASDQSKVLNATFFELINSKTLEVENWTGAGGAFIAERLVNDWFGVFSALIPLFFVYLGLRLMRVSDFHFLKALFITAFGIICGSITSAFILDNLFPNTHIRWGGAHGIQIEGVLESSVGWPGIVLLIILFIIITVVTVKRSSMYKIQKSLVDNKPNFIRYDDANEAEDADESDKISKEPGLIKRFLLNVKKNLSVSKEINDIDTDIIESANTQPEVKVEPATVKPLSASASKPTVTKISGEGDDDFEIIIPVEDEKVDSLNSELKPVKTNEEYDPRKDLSGYKFPTLDLLKVYNTGNREVNLIEQNENKDKIIHTLRNYGIEITSIKATVGPTITLYEIVPQAGVRISKIRNLEDDIALSLSALGIRIIAPMPGKGTVGIEVPNKEPQIVSMHSVLSSKRYQECDFELPVALGKTITNEVFIFDLTKMPHLLVAGATGQGKSVGLNAVITSLLYKRHPAEMKMVLIDPKMVEFNLYSTIEHHYLAKLPDEEKPIITDVSKVTQTLNSLTQEMDDRYELLMKAHVRTIKEYNEKFKNRRLNPNNGHRFMPYIVVVIDEFGDLIMTAGKEIEMPIARIAQKARAVGIHMIIATQRPTTNIITGTIKANFPARMAFRVTSQIDSRTILDMSGANQLIGRGDMLFSQGSILTRIQCAFVDTPELDDITKYIAKQQGYDSAYPLPEVVSEVETGPGAVDLNDRDVLFEEAARLIVVHQQGSTSLIQRKFSIGYNRAGRLMDQLEAAGIVGGTQGSKPREVFIQDEYSLEKLLDSLS